MKSVGRCVRAERPALARGAGSAVDQHRGAGSAGCRYLRAKWSGRRWRIGIDSDGGVLASAKRFSELRSGNAAPFCVIEVVWTVASGVVAGCEVPAGGARIDCFSADVMVRVYGRGAGL